MFCKPRVPPKLAEQLLSPLFEPGFYITSMVGGGGRMGQHMANSLWIRDLEF